MKSWASSYLSIPFVEKGRTRTGVDCYGLVRLIYQEQRGIVLPSYVEDYATTTDYREITALLRNEVVTQWKEVEMADVQTYDGLIFRLLGQPTHFGMVLDPPWFIHALKRDRQDVGRTWIERWDALEWRRRLIATVRWQDAS